MKNIISIVLVILLAFAWLSNISAFIEDNKTYKNYIELAKNNYDEHLYELAIENYENALSVKSSDETLYVEIKNAAKAYYNEQKTADSKTKYTKALVQCCELFETDVALWEELIKIYYEENNYSKAWSYLEKAKKKITLNEYLKDADITIRGKYRLLSANFKNFEYGMNKDYIVNNGEKYWLSDYEGKMKGQEYSYIGGTGKEALTLYKDVTGFVLKDNKEVSRLRLDYNIEECGHFANGVLPIRIDGKYIYINKKGQDANLGIYDYASSMFDGKAAVLKDDKWQILTAEKATMSSEKYDDIALNVYDCYTSGDYFAASTKGTYKLYDLTGKTIGSFSCSDIDIATDSSYFAFKDPKTGLWGYANKKGEIVIEPQYIEAKAFSNGYAAVMNNENLWGVIDDENNLLIPYSFVDVGYFMSDESCVVSIGEYQHSILNFVYR